MAQEQNLRETGQNEAFTPLVHQGLERKKKGKKIFKRGNGSLTIKYIYLIYVALPQVSANVIPVEQGRGFTIAKQAQKPFR